MGWGGSRVYGWRGLQRFSLGYLRVPPEHCGIMYIRIEAYISQKYISTESCPVIDQGNKTLHSKILSVFASVKSGI